MLKEQHRILFICSILLLFYSCTGLSRAQDTVPARNVILFIGDGMGLAQVYAAFTVNKGTLNIMRFPYTGFSKTHPATSYITDSGAGATAIACGKKSFNGAIGVGADSIPCKSILEYAEANGLSTGLVVTSSITHATPACFIAHQTDRHLQEAIALDFLKTDIDVFIGGGADYFMKRSDSTNLMDSLTGKGYDVFLYPPAIDLGKSMKAAVFTAPVCNPRVSEGRGNMLPEATVEAIRMLSRNKKGFFLMVEGSQIDWGGHDNDINYMVEELLDMDKAVGKALAFAENDGNTLVVVTADHETGGLTIIDGDLHAGTIDFRFNADHHTGIMVPVYAYGPGAEAFSGIYENTDIFLKLMHFFTFHNE